jgi:transposase
MPAKNHLTSKQIEKLQKALKSEEKANIREKILILLLLNDGKTQSKLAEFLGCSVNKVSYWCLKGDPDNLESLIDKRMKGNHQKTTDNYLKILLETLEIEPQKLGYDFGRWTAQRLATYVEKSTEIKLSGGQVRRILKQKKYVYLWANYSHKSKRNSEKRTAFKIKIVEYLKIKKESPERLQLWFWDESKFSLIVTGRKNWCKQGSRKNVRGDKSKGRVNVMGGLRYSDKKRLVEFLNKGNSNNFYKVLKIFYGKLINEWVEAGNQASQFAEKGAKIVIVLDNASFHKKEEYLKKFETEMPNLHL